MEGFATWDSQDPGGEDRELDVLNCTFCIWICYVLHVELDEAWIS